LHKLLIMEILVDIYNFMINLGFKGMVAWGLILIYLSIKSLLKFVWTQIRMHDVKVGRNYILKVDHGNPFKQGQYLYAEVVNVKDGYVEYVVEGEAKSKRIYEFISIYEKWPHEDRL